MTKYSEILLRKPHSDPEEEPKLTNYFRVHSGRIWASHAFLILAGLSVKTLKVRRSQFNRGVSRNFEFKYMTTENGPELYYDFLTIPNETKLAYGLPDINEVATNFSESIQGKYRELTDVLPPPFAKEIKLELIHALEQAYKFQAYFYDLNFHEPQLAAFSRKTSVLATIKASAVRWQRSVSKCQIHRILVEEPEFVALDFPRNPKTFYNYLARALACDDLVKFVKGRYGVPSNALKINKDVIDLICYAAGHSNKVAANKVRIWVNTILIAFPNINGGKILEATSIESVINKNTHRIGIMQEGEDYVAKVIAPWLHVIQAEHPFDQFQMDEWHIEFGAKRNNKRVRLILFTIMDACTKKLIHWKTTTKLNSSFVRTFLYETIRLCGGRIPAEIVCDFASVNTAGIIKDVLEYFQRQSKGKFTWTISSNANRKAILERFFGTMATVYLSPIVGFLGQGLLSSRPNASPAKYLEVLLNNPAYLDDEQELTRILDSVLDRYTRNGIHPNEASPNQKFEDLKKPNVIRLEPYQVAYAFYDKESRTMSNCQVVVDKKYYQSFDPSVFSFNSSSNDSGKNVDCIVNKEDSNIAYVFELGTENFIGTFNNEEKFHSAIANQTLDDVEIKRRLFEKRYKLTEHLVCDNQRTAEHLRELTGTDIADFLNTAINIGIPKSSDISIATGQPSTRPKQIDPFDVPPLKQMKRAGANRKKDTTKVNTTRNIIDTLRTKLG